MVQAIVHLKVSVIDGHVNFDIEGSVHSSAKISLHEKGAPIEYNKWVDYRDLTDFLINRYVGQGGVPLCFIRGQYTYGARATSGMKLVVWDLVGDDAELRPYYEFELPLYYTAVEEVTNGELLVDNYKNEKGTGDPHPQPEPEPHPHHQHLNFLYFFIDTGNWNVVVRGRVAAIATLIAYPSPQDHKTDSNGDTRAIGRESYFNPKIVHAETITICEINGTSWWSSHASTTAVFELRDAKFDLDDMHKEPYPRLVFKVHPFAGKSTDRYPDSEYIHGVIGE